MSLGVQGTHSNTQGESAGLNFYPLDRYLFLIKGFFNINFLS